MQEDVACFKGKEVLVSIIERPRARTLQQLRYFRGVLLPLVVEGFYSAGYFQDKEGVIDKSRVYKELMERFFYREVWNDKKGGFDKVVLSMGEEAPEENRVTKQKFNDVLPHIQQWAIEDLKMYIPDPNEEVRDIHNK